MRKQGVSDRSECRNHGAESDGRWKPLQKAYLRDIAESDFPSKQSTPARAQLEQAGEAPSQRTLRRRHRKQAKTRRRGSPAELIPDSSAIR